MAKRNERVKMTGAQHVLATMKATGRLMVIAALAIGTSAAVLVELYGAYASGSFTTPSTHVFAIAFALVCAYGAIVTVLLRGVIATLVDSIEWVSGEVQRFTGSIVREAEAILHGADDHDAPQEAVSILHVSDGHYAAPEPVGSRNDTRP